MKHGLERFSRTFVCAVFCLASIVATATPMISDLKVTPVEPLGLAIDFNVSGATTDNVKPLFKVAMTADGIIYNAQNLVGATNCADGAHRVYWNMAKDGIALDPATAYLTVTYGYQHPRYCVIDLSGGSEANFYPVAYMDAPPSGGFNTTEYKTTKLVLKRVDSGSFIMGDDQMNESHRVTLTKPFYMGLYEVTQRQWELVTGYPCPSTSYGKGDAHPVYCISYNMIRGSLSGEMWPESNAVDPLSFLGKLRGRAKLDFDLPTDAQWEYACRAGTTTTYSYGDSEDGAYMWYLSSSTHEVGTKLPNKWGLYDMHGSVGELCLDWYGPLAYGTDPRGSSSSPYRVVRGGSWNSSAALCTSSHRNISLPSDSNHGLGFRLSRTIPFLAEAGTATVEFALGRICADGSSVDGKVSLGYAPTEGRNAVVAINDEMLLNANEAGSWTWYAATAGTYAISHTVGEYVMSAAYVVTNGYAKVEEAPDPPMDVVEGIALSPSDEIAVAAKGMRQIVKISGNGEEWTGATSADWLKLNSTSGTATGKGIICTIAENVAAEARVGYVYVAGQTLKVTQAGRGATVDAQVTAGTAGGVIAVAVSVPDETTTWSASSECPWIQVETQYGTGSGEVKLRVPPWNKAISRTGTVTIAGQSVVVTQMALETATTGAAVVAQGKTLMVNVETAASVEWAIADVPGWITLVGAASRRGPDIVTLIVSPNTTFEDRTAAVMIAGKAFTVTQDAAKVEIGGGLVRCCNASGCDPLVVTVNVDVETAPWTAEISEEAKDSWVFLMSGEDPVLGDGTFELYIAPAAEGDALPRTATVAVGNATLRITQDDGVVIDGGNVPFIIPATWFAKYPALGGTTVAEWQEIAEGAGVKTDASGAAQPVWHDYVAGTDPTDATSRFTASVALEDGKPVVTWTPALNGDGVREGVRTYRVWGKADLGDAAWSEVAPGGEAGYRFFRVTVEMP